MRKILEISSYLQYSMDVYVDEWEEYPCPASTSPAILQLC